EKLGDWRPLWRENRNRFLEKWATVRQWDDPSIDEPRREQAAVVVEWMTSFYHTRDELLAQRERVGELEKELRSLTRRVTRLSKEASLGYQMRRIPARALRKARHLTRRVSGGSGQSQ